MIRDSRHRQPNGQPHTEYIWYLPTTRQDGTLQPPAAIEQAHQAIAQMGKNIQRFRPCRGNWITAKGHLVQDTLIPSSSRRRLAPKPTTRCWRWRPTWRRSWATTPFLCLPRT